MRTPEEITERIANVLPTTMARWADSRPLVTALLAAWRDECVEDGHPQRQIDALGKVIDEKQAHIVELEGRINRLKQKNAALSRKPEAPASEDDTMLALARDLSRTEGIIKWIIRGWEALPAGTDYPVDLIQAWLDKHLHPVVQSARRYLSMERETLPPSDADTLTEQILDLLCGVDDVYVCRHDVRALLSRVPRAESYMEKAVLDEISKRDHAEETIDTLLEIIGVEWEWSSSFGFNEALEAAEEKMASKVPITEALEWKARAEAAEAARDILREALERIAGFCEGHGDDCEPCAMARIARAALGEGEG